MSGSYPPIMTLTAVAKSVLLLVTLALPSLAQAEPGCMANINLALTLSSTTPGTFERGPNGEYILDGNRKRIPASYYFYTTTNGLTGYEERFVKAATVKYGMRELLEDLREKGVFPAGETSIKGWSLKLVNTADREDFHTYLYKTGHTPVKVTDVLAVGIVTSFLTGKTNAKAIYAAPKGPVKSATMTGTLNFKGTVNLSLGGETLGFGVSMQGMGTGTAKPKLLPGNIETIMLVSVKTTGLHGEFGGPGSVKFAEGTFSTTAPVLVEDLAATFPDFF